VKDSTLLQRKGDLGVGVTKKRMLGKQPNTKTKHTPTTHKTQLKGSGSPKEEKKENDSCSECRFTPGGLGRFGIEGNGEGKRLRQRKPVFLIFKGGPRRVNGRFHQCGSSESKKSISERVHCAALVTPGINEKDQERTGK